MLASYNTDIAYTNGEILKRVQIGNALGGIYGFKFKGVYAYDYDHSGYFQQESKNNWTDQYGNPNTAAGNLTSAENWKGGVKPRPELAKSTPIMFDANGNVVYDKNGNPLPMYFNYGGKITNSMVVMLFTKILIMMVTLMNLMLFT